MVRISGVGQPPPHKGAKKLKGFFLDFLNISEEGGGGCKKVQNWPDEALDRLSDRPSATSKAAYCKIRMAKGQRPKGQPTCRVWMKASLLCSTQVMRVWINCGVV